MSDSASSDARDERLRRYAELAVRVGTNLQPGQQLEIVALVEHAPLARAISKAAWEAGAGYVSVFYEDQHAKHDLVEYGSDEALTRSPNWMVRRIEELGEAQGARIELAGNPAPDLFADLDPARVGRARMVEVAEVRGRELGQGRVSWCIVAFPNEGWAESVFGEPDVERLWQAVASCVRLDRPDPVAAWREHMARLKRRAEGLNGLDLDAVRYRGPGTDLTVGLNPGSVWGAAEFETAWGQTYVPNLPTEEVFTTPDPERAEGVIRSSKPLFLSTAGVIVRDLELRLEGGRIVDVRASTGAEVVRAQLTLDERAPYLGEIALVDRTSEVGRTGLLFCNTLFDENASAHIAWGRGLTMGVRGSRDLPRDELQAVGVNQSVIHTDFMVGSAELEVDGLTRDGRAVPILRDDTWQVDE